MEDPRRQEDTHDRLLRLEERLKVWMASVENRLGAHSQTGLLILGILLTALGSLVVALLTRVGG